MPATVSTLSEVAAEETEETHAAIKPQSPPLSDDAPALSADVTAFLASLKTLEESRRRRRATHRPAATMMATSSGRYDFSVPGMPDELDEADGLDNPWLTPTPVTRTTSSTSSETAVNKKKERDDVKEPLATATVREPGLSLSTQIKNFFMSCRPSCCRSSETDLNDQPQESRGRQP